MTTETILENLSNLKSRLSNPKDLMTIREVENLLSKKLSNKRNQGVYCITLDKHYSTIKDAEADTGVGRTNISTCCSGKTHYAGVIYGKKLVWKYEDEENV